MIHSTPHGNINYLFNFFDRIFTCTAHSSDGLNCPERAMLVLAVVLLVLVAFVFLMQVVTPWINIVFKRGRSSFHKDVAFKGWALTTFLSGWWVYMIGFCDIGSSESGIALLFRPLISSLEQFVFHSDLIEVAECCHDSAWFMTFYTLSFGSAVCISSFVVVNCFWRRLHFLMKRLVWSCKYSDLIYVFFGVNDKALCLARSICSRSTDATSRGRIIFVNFPEDKGEEHANNSLSRIFGLNSFDKEIADSIRGMNGIIVNASSEIFDDKNYGENNPFVLQDNGLGRLIRPLRKACKIKLFFLSEDESQNVRAAINVVSSRALLDREVDIYCKARRNYENYTLVDNSCAAHLHLVDDSAYAVNTLKLMGLEKGKPVAHPVNFVRVDSTLGVVESKFNCLIVGFGQTGQDALRFLYEFSSFVGTDGEKSPVHFRVADRQMDILGGFVRSEIPAIRTDDGFSGVIPPEEIDLRRMDYRTAEFWKMLEKQDEPGDRSFIQRLNCIVIAVGNDEENIALATQLYEFAIRHDAIGGKENEKLKIFVRAYNPEAESRLRKVEEYYGKENDVIRVFGYLQDIYSYDVIIENQIQKAAEEFFGSYNSLSGGNGSWKERHDLLRSGTVTERIGVRHKEKQDRSNALHQYTKMQLLGDVSEPLPSVYPFITEEALAGVMTGEYVPSTGEDAETMKWYARLQNLSKCEHLRWMSAHYMLGYLRFGDEKNFRQRRHMCLVDWNQTDIDSNGHEREILRDYKIYDYKVVETTIANSLKKKESGE